MRRIASTLCGLVMALGLGAKEPLRKTAVDLSTHKDSLSYVMEQRLDSASFYDIPLSKQEIKDIAICIDWVKVKQIPKSIPRLVPQHIPLPVFTNDSSMHLPNTWGPGAVASYYFQTDEHTLTENDNLDLAAMVNYYRRLGISHVVIEGRADFRYNAQHNMNLSDLRCNPFVEALRKGIPHITIECIAFGEAHQVCVGEDSLSLAKNRVVNIIPGMSAVERGLNCVEADYALVDGSWSMRNLNEAGYAPWSIIVNHLWMNKKVYLFSQRFKDWEPGDPPWGWPSGLEFGSDPSGKDGYYPFGTTPLKPVLLYTALTANPGDVFEVFTDGEASKSVVTYDKIIEVAQKRNVTFSFVSTCAKKEAYNNMKKVAFSTKGQVYLARPAVIRGRYMVRANP